MNLYPDYHKQFICIGKNCISTCCAGWGIDFDSETVDFYRSQTDAFGKYVNENIEKKQGTVMVTMQESKRCPFLDKEGLCQIYQNYGEEHMSVTCRNFPRRKRRFNEHVIHSMSLSCEGILELLYNKPEAIGIIEEGELFLETMGDLRMKELAWFLKKGCQLLQDTSLPLSVALGTIVYTGIEADEYYEINDFDQFEASVCRMPETAKQFLDSKEELSAEELMDASGELIFGIVDTFCHIVREQNVYDMEKILWPSYVFEYSDEERKQYIRTCLANKDRGLKHQNFLRKLATACFWGHASAMGIEKNERIFLQDICNYLVLAEVLPLTWECTESQNTKQYFSRMSMISRRFEQAKIVQKIIWPVIRELFMPDVFSYTVAFMALFDS